MPCLVRGCNDVLRGCVCRALREQDGDAFRRQVNKNQRLDHERVTAESNLQERTMQLKKAYRQIDELRDEVCAGVYPSMSWGRV